MYIHTSCKTVLQVSIIYDFYILINDNINDLGLYICYLGLSFILFQAIHEDKVTAVDALLKHGEDATSESLVERKEYEQIVSTTL